VGATQEKGEGGKPEGGGKKNLSKKREELKICRSKSFSSYLTTRTSLQKPRRQRSQEGDGKASAPDRFQFWGCNQGRATREEGGILAQQKIIPSWPN